MNIRIGASRGSPVVGLSMTVAIIAMIVVSLLGLGRASLAAAPVEVPGNSETTHDLFENILNGEDLTAAREIVSEDALIHTPDATLLGMKGLELYLADLRYALPDAEFLIVDLVDNGDAIMVLWSVTGTHSDKYMEFAPTGAVMTVLGTGLFRFEKTLIVEAWIDYNHQALMRQISYANANVYMEHGGGPLPVTSLNLMSNWEQTEIDYDGPEPGDLLTPAPSSQDTYEGEVPPAAPELCFHCRTPV